MRLRKLHDLEHYIVTTSSPRGTGVLIVSGLVLKERDFWRYKLHCLPIPHSLHWTRRLKPYPITRWAQKVDVLLPWWKRNQLGCKEAQMHTTVWPWSLSATREEAWKRYTEGDERAFDYILDQCLFPKKTTWLKNISMNWL